MPFGFVSATTGPGHAWRRAVGDLTEFPLPTRLFLKGYPWRRIDPLPWTPLGKPVVESRLALVTSAGLHLPSQDPFDASIPGGDPSFRVIPSGADPSSLVESQQSRSFSHAGIRRDPNLALPIDRARELVRRRRIGSLAPRHLSFMGSITAPGRLRRDTAPRAASLLLEDAADIALLVPV